MKTVIEILDQANGIKKDKLVYLVQEPVEVTLHIGKPGQGLSINHVESIELADQVAKITTRPHGNISAVYLDDIRLISIHSPEKKNERRTGF